jgi:phage terminase large subunit GpA-like protein
MTADVCTAHLADPGCYTVAFRAGLRPDPVQTIDEWADQHVQLPSYVAEAGQWRTSRTPYLQEIMQCLSPSHPCRKVVFMKPVQVGGTQAAVNWLGFVIARALGAMLIFEPTKDLAKKISKEKVDPMLELTPCLQGKVKEARSRDSGNTTFAKEYLGGFVNFIGANSAVGMRFTSAPYIVIDEVDAYPHDIDDEGHPADLIEKRAATYARYKIFELSTPLVADSSRIEPDYEKGSRGRYHVPCPFCGHLQHLQWGQLMFTFDGVKRPEDAAYQCAGCGALIPERYKTWMMDPVRARWIHEDPDNPVRSFHLNLLYQPYGWAYPWARLAQEWLAANDKLKAGDPRDLKTFTNTILAETWEEKGEKVEHSELYQRRETYEAPCPAGVLVLTAAVDVQDDRLEAEIVGWGKDEEAWSIEYRRFAGSPGQPQVWKDLTDWLQLRREHADGIALRVEAVGVDTGGHHTKEAYWYVGRYRGRAYALKGSNQHGAPFIPPRPKTQRRFRLQLHQIGTVAGKDTLFPRFKLAAPGPGYMHWPNRPEYDEEYFAQLASEEKRHKYDRGVQIGYYYKKIRTRNEALDLWVYNLATLSIWNPPLDQMAAEWERLTARAKARQIVLPSTEEPAVSTPVPAALVTPSAAARGRRLISSGVA